MFINHTSTQTTFWNVISNFTRPQEVLHKRLPGFLNTYSRVQYSTVCHITTGAIIWKWKIHNFTRNRPRPGARCKVSDRGMKLIIRVVQGPPGESYRKTSTGTNVSKQTVCHALNYHGRYASLGDTGRISTGQMKPKWNSLDGIIPTTSLQITPKNTLYQWRWELHGLEVKEEKSAKFCSQNDEDEIRVDDPKHSQGNSPLVSE